MGTCSALTLLFVAIALGMSNGAAVVVSQLFGARRLDEMKRSVATALLLPCSGWALASRAGYAKRQIGCSASVLGVQGYLLDDAVLYFRVYAAGLLFQFVYNIVSAILRSLGDSRAPIFCSSPPCAMSGSIWQPYWCSD